MGFLFITGMRAIMITTELGVISRMHELLKNPCRSEVMD